MTTLTPIPTQIVPRNKIEIEATVHAGWRVPDTLAELDAELGLSASDFASLQLLPKAVTTVPQDIERVVFIPTIGAGLTTTVGEHTVASVAKKPTAADVQRLRDWLLSDSLDWAAVERARQEAWQ